MTVMKFINKNRKSFFIFFYRKPQHMCIYFINLQKKYENGGVSSRVLNPSIFIEGMALPAASFLSSLYAWFRLHVG